MKKYLFLLLFIVSAATLLTAQQQEVPINTVYAAAKSLFQNYEKENGHYITTDNVKMHYLTWGNPKDTPLIWLHGTYSNAYELYDIAEKLVANGIYVIGIDYYGHGLTPRPDKEVSLYDVADDIDFLMRKLAINKAIVGGWSRGGSIATAFYDAYPSKVIGLILEDGGSVAWDEPEHKNKVIDFEKDINAYFNNYKEAPIYKTELAAYASVLERNTINSQNAIASNKRILFTDIASLQKLDTQEWAFNPFVSKMICEDAAENYLDAVHRTFQAKTLFCISAHLIYPKIIYRNLNVPMLLFDPKNEADWFEFEKENKALKDSHPDLIKLKLYSNTGHGIKHEHPERFIKDVLIFIKEIEEKYSTLKHPKLVKLWETDTILKDVESAIYDEKNEIIYVTNINGDWLKPNGKGFISKVNLVGKITHHKWIENIEGPTGTALYGDKLFVADFDTVLEIDVNKAKILKRHQVEGTQRINDLTVDENGTIYGSGTKSGKLFALKNGEIIILKEELEWPNGVLYDNENILIGLGDETIHRYNLIDKTTKVVATNISNPDGIIAIGNGDYLISSWEGLIHYVTKDGKKTLLLDTTEEGVNAADICYIPSKKMLLVPAMLNNKLIAYTLEDEQ